MAIIQNKLNQSLALYLSTGKRLGLRAKGTCEISEKELALPEIQRLIANQTLVVKEKKKIVKDEKVKETSSESKRDKKIDLKQSKY